MSSPHSTWWLTANPSHCWDITVALVFSKLHGVREVQNVSHLLLTLSVAFTFWSWVVSQYECAWRRGWVFLPQVILFQGWWLPRCISRGLVTGILASGMQSLLCPSWSLAAWSLPCSVASFSPDSETILWGRGKSGCFPVPCWGLRTFMEAQGLCLRKTVLTTFLLATASQGQRAWCRAEAIACSQMLSASSHLGRFYGVGGSKTRKTRSSWSHILPSSFHLTSGQRALTFMAKNVMSLFSGSIKATFLKW